MVVNPRNPALYLVFAVLISCSTSRNRTASEDLQIDRGVFPRTDSLLVNLLKSNPVDFSKALEKSNEWRIQIIYSQINRDEKNHPTLKHYYYNVDPSVYFYPASTVKMPAAILALQRLNELSIDGLNRNSIMITEAASPEQTTVMADTTNENGKPSVAHYIKKIFLVSDNEAYNRLYEFLGQEYLNKALWKLGFTSAELQHRLSISLTEEQNRLTNPVSFFDSNGKLLYKQPSQKSNLTFKPRKTLIGTGYLSGGKLVSSPFDFSKKNQISLTDLHSILQTLLFPETLNKQQRFKLTQEDYAFLYKYMSMTPGESRFPRYDSSYTDAYVKFLLFGGGGKIGNKDLRIFNKVGDAYGFLQDVAYVVDFKNGVEFLLSATVYCNSDGVFNDDKYDYDTIGFPFLKRLGEVIYQYELARPKKHQPDLSRYRVDYVKPE